MFVSLYNEVKPVALPISEETTDADSPAAFIVQGANRDTSSCAGRKGLNLKGELLNDGGSHIKDKAEDCCADCRDLPECNVWVYCEGDCVDYAYHSCWLKRAKISTMGAPDAWAASSDVPWTSGWFPPKEGFIPVIAPAAAPTVPTTGSAPVDATVVPTQNATAVETESEPDIDVKPEAASEPDIRVVPITQPTPTAPLPEAQEQPGTEPEPESASEPQPDEITVETTEGDVTFTLTPGEPLVIPASMITIVPGAKIPEDGNVSLFVPAPVQGPTAAVNTTAEQEPRSEQEPSVGIPSQDPETIGCDAAAVATCPPERDAPASDPLESSRIRGSFQLLRSRDAETGGAESESLTLLRPGDEVDEIYVTGTLINANPSGAVCLSGLEVPFAFPRTVLTAAGTAPLVTAQPEDFVVQCYYVGVRSREASRSPSARSAQTSPGSSSGPRACNDTVALTMTDEGPIMTFRDDVSLCSGCWLVGGRDGVLFSWKHKDGLPMRVSAGDALGAERARCGAFA